MGEIHILAGIETAAADRETLLSVLRELVAGSRKEAGCRRYDVMQREDNELSFMVFETWASAQAIEEHNATPHFKKLVDFLNTHPAKLTINKYTQLI